MVEFDHKFAFQELRLIFLTIVRFPMNTKKIASATPNPIVSEIQPNILTNESHPSRHDALRLKQA